MLVVVVLLFGTLGNALNAEAVTWATTPVPRPAGLVGIGYGPVRAECPAGVAAANCPAPLAERSQAEWQQLHQYCAGLLKSNPAEARHADGLCRQSGVVR